MRKDDSLRAAVVAALPELARDAQSLKVWLGKGSIAGVATNGIGWEYRYELSLLLMDFAASPDLVFHAIIQWLRDEQPDLLLNPGALEKDLRFEIDIIDDKASDVLITLSLSEAVVGVQHLGGVELVHPATARIDDDDLLAPGARLVSVAAGAGQP